MTTIRPGTTADLPAIRRLYNALIPTTTVAWRDDIAASAEIRDWFEARQQAGHPVLVAHLDRTVVGYTCWSGFRSGDQFPGYRHTVEHTIHVDRRFLGRGVGRTLLTALISEATLRGVHVMVAGIDGENVASIEFHHAMGFTEVARMPQVGRKFNRWLDLVLMQRIIT